MKVADRVVFVGPQAGHVNRLQQGEARDRLFTFVTSLPSQRVSGANG